MAKGCWLASVIWLTVWTENCGDSARRGNLSGVKMVNPLTERMRILGSRGIATGMNELGL